LRKLEKIILEEKMVKIDKPQQFLSDEKFSLISEIRQRESIWNDTHPTYRDHRTIAKLWLDVKVVMDTKDRQFTGTINASYNSFHIN
jgi:hypothetical protein